MSPLLPVTMRALTSPLLLLAASLFMPNAAAALSAPVLPLSVAAPGSWPPPGSLACGGSGASCGDVRAVVQLSASDISGDTASVQVWWRRRDPHAANKTVLVLDAKGSGGFTVAAAVERDCGVVQFSRAGLSAGVYHLYYLPFRQGGGGAGLRFSWQGCDDQTPTNANVCVQARRRLEEGSSVCALPVSPSAAAVVGVENRDAFNAFTDMEQMATDAEAAATAAALGALSPPPFVGVFPEASDRSVRVFDAGIPARWALGGAGPQPAAAPTLALSAPPGQWLAFQLGLWAFAAPVSNVSGAATAFVAPSGASIPSTAFTFLNFAGSDVAGVPFTNTAYSLAAGAVGSVWCGLAIPADAAPGVYTGTATLSAAAGGGAPVTTTVVVAVSGAPVPLGGAGDITSMARLAWLDSTRGLEDTVPAPHVPVGASGGGGVPLVVTSHFKELTLGDDGLPAAVAVTYNRVRGGAPAPVVHALLSAPVAFSLWGGGAAAPLPTSVTAPAALTHIANASLAWSSAWDVGVPGGGTVSVTLTGTLDFTSYVNYAVTLSNRGAAGLSLSDVRLTVPVAADMAGFIVGMDNSGAQACEYKDRVWRWTNTTGANKVFVGRPEAGVVVNLKGDGTQWDSPMFGADYPTVPFVPPTWGGVDALPSNNAFGVNVTNATVTAFSGPRTLAPGAAVTFLFDLALTPSKATDWTKHWATRTQQLGYDIPYAPPADVAARGVTVVTLHQGTGGVVDGELINPYINYPFLNDTVPMLTDFTAQSNKLGMMTKFYYTIRELSSHAPEIFAFAAQQGEILVDEDPYTIVQPGYAHSWNTHGGSAFLHQHMVSHYGACWQQTLTNGEIDPSVCTRGVSRLFNYYLEGLHWSFSQPPYINGIYYDGTNFPRGAMIRIRRAADAAATAAGKGFPALLDLHTGREGTPDVCSYATHYPLMGASSSLVSLALARPSIVPPFLSSKHRAGSRGGGGRPLSYPPPLPQTTCGTEKALTLAHPLRTGWLKSPPRSTASRVTCSAPAREASSGGCSLA